MKIQPIYRATDIGRSYRRKPGYPTERRKNDEVPEGFQDQLLAGLRRTDMKNRQDLEHDAALEALHPLVGKRVAGVVRTDDDGDGAFAGLEFDDGTVVWFNRDTEGNGPGWPAVEPPAGTK